MLVFSSVANNPALSQDAIHIEFEVLRQLGHDESHFTQGLFFHEGNLYESTGQRGRSQLIRYDEDFETPLMARSVAPRYFAEGAAVQDGVIYQLTWQAGVALAYSPRRLSKEKGFTYEGEGWGLASDGDSLWLSDGSATIKKMDTDGTLLSKIEVTLDGKPLNRLNELEWIDGVIYANRWYSTRIYLIDPESGVVSGFLNLSSLAEPELARGRENVLNGIAWNSDSNTLWITGKNWQNLYELRLLLELSPEDKD